MAYCKSCGADIGDAKFCPACGTQQTVVPSAQESIPVQPETPVFKAPETVSPILTGSGTANASGSADAQIPPVYTAPVYSPASSSQPMPETSGQTIFSVVNIVLGAILCCCFGAGFPSMVLGIIAVVFCSQAKKAASAEEAAKKLKTAKILNIIAVVLLALSLIFAIIVIASGIFTSTLSDYGYNYGFEDYSY